MKNIGRTDKTIRFFLGVLLLSLLFLLNGSARFVGLIGLIPLATAFAGFCPTYALVRINTNNKQHK